MIDIESKFSSEGACEVDLRAIASNDLWPFHIITALNRGFSTRKRHNSQRQCIMSGSDNAVLSRWLNSWEASTTAGHGTTNPGGSLSYIGIQCCEWMLLTAMVAGWVNAKKELEESRRNYFILWYWVSYSCPSTFFLVSCSAKFSTFVVLIETQLLAKT